MLRRSGSSSRAALVLVLTLAGAGLMACAEDPLLPEPTERTRIAFDEDLDRWPRSAWTLQTAEVADDTLVLSVQFAGGCREHRFWLLAVDGWMEVPSAGPLDTRAVSLLLAHDDGGDRCEAALTRSLRFDLDPLRQDFRIRFGEGPARIFLRVPEAQSSDEVRLVEWRI